MDFVTGLLKGIGVAVPCGLNPYLSLLVLGIAGASNRMKLEGPFNFLGSWPVVIVLAVVVGIDIFFGKLPTLEKFYTRLSYVVRPIAGGFAFTLVMPPSQLNPAISFLLGFALAAATYFLITNLKRVTASGSKYAVVFVPLVGIVEDFMGAILTLLTMFVPLVGGPLSIALLIGAGMTWVFMLQIRKLKALSATEPEQNQPVVSSK